MKKWLKISITIVILAVVFHLITVAFFPSLVMRVAHRKISERAGGVNVVIHLPPTTADNNPIVNSSPDILYSACAFDLSGGPVRFNAQIPDSYWSISGFDAKTNNFFVINNEQVKSKNFELILVGAGETPKIDVNTQIIKSPTARGVVLFRTLVPVTHKIEGLIRTQKMADCTPYQ